MLFLVVAAFHLLDTLFSTILNHQCCKLATLDTTSVDSLGVRSELGRGRWSVSVDDGCHARFGVLDRNLLKIGEQQRLVLVEELYTD